MEPPSRQLVELLTRYGLAKPRDLRRCRSIVRRLARDLPTFDSVWIDALTQKRVITPFQGKLLESDDPDRLGVGPCVLLDEWERDGYGALYVARHRVSRRKCLLTYVHVADDFRTRARASVGDLISALRGMSHPSIIVPQGCDDLNDRLVVVSPFATGPTLQQLLVRRGRFPIPVVTEIAGQLIDALAALETRAVVHGDLRLATVRLTSQGRTLLLNPGVLPSAGSRISYHDTHPADAYDGIAPELISTGHTASFRSDVYALGCLLWQLLTGRPPFPTGDPLSKLAAHQSRAIDDVRRWRPDAPEVLASLITELTHKDAERRPAGPRTVRDRWRFDTRSGRRGLAKFHASFGAVAPRQEDSHKSAVRFPWPVAAGLLLVMSSLSLALLDAGARNELLRMTAAWSRPSDLDSATSSVLSLNGESGLLPFPEDAVNGVIELISDGPYAPGSIESARPLTIRAGAGVSPTVVVGEQPHRVTAQSVQIIGVRFEAEQDTTAINETPVVPVPVLLAVRSQQLAVDHCVFDRSRTAGQGTAVAWKVPDESDPNGGHFVSRRSRFEGDLRALDLHAMPRIIGFDNCLKRGDGPLIRLSSASRRVPLRVHLRQSTLRDSGSILHWSRAASEGQIQPTLLIVENSVFAFGDSQNGLLDFANDAPVGWERMLQLTGEGSLIRPQTPLAVSQNGVIDDSQLRVEGLVIDAFEFAGHDGTVAASVVASTQAPRSSTTVPGIIPRAMSDVTSEEPLVRRASHEYNRQ